MTNMNTKKLTDQQLLETYALVMEELKEREIIRTSNNPVGDFAEYLVAQKMNLKLAVSSTAGYDAEDDKGVRYQIKSRRITKHTKQRQLGVMRNLDKRDFDYLVAVLFDDNFNVTDAYQIPLGVIKNYSKYSEHQHGDILQLKGAILSDKKVKNIISFFK